MNLFRIATLAWSDIRLAWRKPLPIIMLLILGLLVYGLSAGGVSVSLGSEGDIGGKKTWVNAETSIALVDLIFLGLMVPFFASVQCGLTLANDEDKKLDRMLLSTPLSALEYATGRFLGSLVPLLIVLALFVGWQILIVQLYPYDKEGLLGPFQWTNFLRPMFLYCLPLVLFTAGTALFLGTLTRQAVLVFAVPTVLVVAGALFWWSFNPSWLPIWVDKLLEWTDPAGVRWYTNTFFKEPRGADYLNQASTVPEFPMLLSRIVMVVIGLACVPLAAQIVHRRVRGQSPRVGLESIPATSVLANAAELAQRPMPASSHSKPGWLSVVWAMLRLELRSLVRSPGLWLFAPLIIMEVVVPGLVRTGPFETFVLSTPGSIAGENFNTLTLLLLFLILYYTVESLVREERHGMSSLINSTPAATGAMLTGKVLANGALACVIAFGGFLGALMVLGWQYFQTGIWFGVQPEVFLTIWGLLLAPTLILWSAYVMFLFTVTRNRYATFGLGLGTLIGTGFLTRWGYLNWASLWHLWGGVRWSELDRLAFDWSPVFWNRILMLAIAAVLLALTLRFYPRQVSDARGVSDRFQPGRLLWSSLPIFLLALPAIAMIIGMLVTMRRGPEGGPLVSRTKDYWKQNTSTWKDAPVPALDRLQATIDLHPETRSFQIKGEYLLRNRSKAEMDAVPLTLRPHLKVSTWKIDGTELPVVKPIEREGRPSIEDRSGLLVIRPAKPLAPDATCMVAFELEGTLPAGWTKKPNRPGQFVLPSGIVLVSFDGSMLPIPGFMDDVGLEKKDQPEAREYPDDYYKQQVDPLFGPAWGTDIEMTISAPADWTVNGVGNAGPVTIVEGRKTMTWKTSEKVRFFNIVGGPASMIETKGGQSSVFHARQHSFHAARMAEVLDGARQYYGEWFHPYPWDQLRLTEFPGLADYAQGFPGNITFSESIGFLARKAEKDEADVVDYIVAHEAAHQWWGNILTPGKGPGGNVLSEGTANFSSLLLLEKMRGTKPRQSLLRKYEREYVQARNPDRERPLNKVDGSRPGDNTLIYNRAGFVFWMLLEEMGRERMLKGCRDFIQKFKDGPDFPLLEDFVILLRSHAADPVAYDAFVNQWILGKVLPEFKIADVRHETDASGKHVTRGTLTNVGTGKIKVEIEACRTRLSDKKAGSKEVDEPRELGALQTLTLDAGQSVPWELTSSFKPAEVLVDPNIKLLQMGRKLAKTEVP